MEIKIPNKYLLGLASWLNELQLPAKENISRSYFVQKLREEIIRIEHAKQDIAKKYTNLNENGDPLIVEGHWDIPDDKIEDFSKEINALLDDATILVLVKEEYDSIKRLVLDTLYIFGPRHDDSEQEKHAKIRQQNEYPEWCKLFEKE